MGLKRYGKRIKKEGDKFFLEVFYPEHTYKFLGKLITFIDTKAFVTHIKNSAEHWLRKGQGYAINEELLNLLYNAGVQHILIPEDTKTQGFRVWRASVGEYLKGDFFHEEHTERQRCIPLRYCKELNIDKPTIKRMLGI